MLMRDIVDVIKDQVSMPGLIRIADVGAMKVGGNEAWQGLIDRGLATLLGFEPQPEECARCNAEAGEGREFLPLALGDGGTWPFYRCKFPATSSIFEPDHDFIHQFNGLVSLMEVVERSELETRRLDDVAEARETDFLKLDIQGAELLVLENAVETLGHVSIIQTEVSFVPLYIDQPLFADVDRFIRSHGFMLHTMLGFGKRALQPTLINNDPYAGLNQFLWSDVVYVKPFSNLIKGQSPATLLKRAMLFHTLYGSYDFATRALQDYDRFAGTRMANAYVAGLAEQQAA